MMRLLPICLLLTLVVLACSSSGEKTGKDDEQTDPDAPPVELGISPAEVRPGQFLRLTHPDATVDQSYKVTISDGASYSVPAWAYTSEAGVLEFFAPVYLDPDSGNSVAKELSVTVEGLEGELAYTVTALPNYSGITAAGMIAAVTEESVRQYDQAIAALNRMTKEATATEADVDFSEQIAAYEGAKAAITTLAEEFKENGTLTLNYNDDSSRTLTAEELQFGWQVYLARILGEIERWEQEEALAGYFGLTDHTADLSPEEIQDIHAMQFIRQVQFALGRDARSEAVQSAALNLGVSSLGAVTGAIGTAADRASAVLATLQFGMTLSDSTYGASITSAGLNVSRLEKEQTSRVGTAVGLLGIGSASVLAAWLIPGFLQVATVGSIAFAVGGALLAPSTPNIYFHMPPDGADFSEVRVITAGGFDIPRFTINFVDDPNSESYDVRVQGLVDIPGSSTTFANPELWHTVNVNKQLNTLTYGVAQYGSYNTARGSDSRPATPAPSLADLNFYSFIVTGKQNETQARGRYTVHYYDGPLTFTFRLDQTSIRLPAPRTDEEPTPLQVTGRIFNGTSIPLIIDELMLELEPGDPYFEPIYENESTALVTVEPGATETFTIENIKLTLGQEYYGRAFYPRLVVGAGAGSHSDQRQIVFADMRSAPALSGPLVVLDPTTELHQDAP